MMVKMKPTREIYAGLRRSRLSILGAVAADRFDRATFHRFLAKTFFLGRFRLFVNVGVTAVVIALEIRRRSFPAQIAVDALFIDIEFAGGIFGIFVGGVGHNFSLREREIRWKRARCNSKPKLPTRVAGELKTAERLGKIDILRQSKDLKASAKHFRMEKRLHYTLRFFIFYDLRKRRDDAGQKVMLIGKTSNMQ